MEIIETIKSVASSFVNLFGIYLVWIVIHYGASHLYIKLCVPDNVNGFILSPFIAPAPHCQALRWSIYNGGNSISAMWIILGAWSLSHLQPIRIFRNNPSNKIK